MSQSFLQLLDIPLSERDQNWEEEALKLLPTAQFHILSEDPQKGPDGWPYLMVETTDHSDAEPAQRVLAWLSDKGIGLAVNPRKDMPDYVLTYGMLWNFRQTGRFVQPQKDAHTGQVKFNAGQKVHAGPPSDQYLPDYARTILKAFLSNQNRNPVRVLVMGQPEGHYDFCFSLESLGNPPPHEHRGILEAISWFLPSHYSMVLVSEKGLPQFFEL